ncbi:PTS fructose transporter subunit IIB [Enterococcus florum]|uniref:PTS fructose transporter subunit IIB n=1 Tax=Enterococcus florum TaxID=2480627 RepID=A0A4P5PG23_9ENTE|nr:PTS sugar transporter subunit IIB [Enterococcus florum]GCF92443.1 PTS fructose transporter subunit IIB [Enterococcus florum]
MKQYNVLSVCGSGTVTSSMVAEKLREALEEKGYRITTTEARPTEALQLAQGGSFDFITYTSPLPEGDYGVPVVNAIGFLTGFGDEEFLEEIDGVLAELDKR